MRHLSVIHSARDNIDFQSPHHKNRSKNALAKIHFEWCFFFFVHQAKSESLFVHLCNYYHQGSFRMKTENLEATDFSRCWFSLSLFTYSSDEHKHTSNVHNIWHECLWNLFGYSKQWRNTCIDRRLHTQIGHFIFPIPTTMIM